MLSLPARLGTRLGALCSKTRSVISSRLSQLLWVGLLSCLFGSPALAQNDASLQPAAPNIGAAAGVLAEDPPPSSITAQLNDLRQRIADKENQIKALREQRRALPVGYTDQELLESIKSADAQLATLRRSFEQLAVDGIDLSVFDREIQKTYDWQSELLDIVRPVLASLKELTEKPRRIEALRRAIERAGEQIQAADAAIASIEKLQAADPEPKVAGALGNLREEWLVKRREINSNRELFKVQLGRLEEQVEVAWSTYLQPLWDFLAGRGLTLLLAAAAALLIWFALRLVLAIALKLRGNQQGRKARTRERATRYLYRALTVSLVFFGVLAVFYIRSDMLLLALTIVLLIMAVASLRQAIPRYISEIRLLLDVGPVREGERIEYGGVPMRVVSINAFAVLANPELTGYVRVPLGKLDDMQSRPAIDEPWFPSQAGDYLMMADDRFVEVLGQSVERVRLRHKGSEFQMSSADWVAAGPMNMSRDGFVVVVTFGIDYAHQAICLTEVPQKMTEALSEALSAHNQAEHHRSLLVDFKAANAHSLDYLIVAGYAGQAAGSYFGIGRLIQQTLVAVCQREGWSIPFEQLTVHLPEKEL